MGRVVKDIDVMGDEHPIAYRYILRRPDMRLLPHIAVFPYAYPSAMPESQQFALDMRICPDDDRRWIGHIVCDAGGAVKHGCRGALEVLPPQCVPQSSQKTHLTISRQTMARDAAAKSRSYDGWV